MLLKIISWNPFLVCNERSVLSNNRQSHFPILPAPSRKVPFFCSIHSGDTWPNKGSIYLQELWGPRDHSSTGPRGERVMTWIWPQWAQWAPAHGESWTQSFKSVSFNANRFVFRRVAAFICTFQLPADRDLQTRVKEHISRYNRSFSSLLSIFPFCFYICFLFFLLRFLRAASPSSGRGGT